MSSSAYKQSPRGGPNAGSVDFRRRARLFWVIGVGLTGAAVSLALYVGLRHREYQLAEAGFRLHAQKRAEMVHRVLSDRLDVVRILVAFYSGSDSVKRSDFHVFGQPLLEQNPDAECLAWVPRVARSEREAHEQSARKKGVAAYQITERDAQGHFVPAAEHDYYYPIYYVDPSREEQSLLGFDLGSQPECREALQRARETGRAVAAVAAPLEKADGDGCALYAFAPIDTEEPREEATTAARPRVLAGFVLGVFRIDQFVTEGIEQLEPAGVDTYLLVESASGTPSLVFAHPSRLQRQPTATSATVPPNGAGGLHYTGRFDEGGRHWRTYCVATEAYLADNRTWWPAGALAAGLALSALLAGYLLLLTKRTTQVEKLATERTIEFETICKAVQDAVVLMDADGRIVHWNPAAERIFGYPRDEIVGRRVHEALVPARYRERALKGLAEFARHGRGEAIDNLLELEAVRKDGAEFPVEMSLSPILLDGKWWALAIVRDVTKRKRWEEALRQEQRLLKELLNLQERDRKLVAYEIHDGLAQMLTGAIMKFQSIDRLRHSDPVEAQRMFDAAMQLLADSMGETRRLIAGLRPPILDEAGIVAALEYLVEEQRRRQDQQIEFAHDVHFTRLAAPLESALFRIVQEGLTNAARHGRSKKVSVQLVQGDGRIRVEIRDWGVGFNPNKVAANRYGLRGIRERARLLGGEATIDAAPGQGTRVTVELPLVEPMAGEDAPGTPLEAEDAGPQLALPE